MIIKDSYVENVPSVQNIIDIFGSDTWASRLPIDGVHSGFLNLFNDNRIKKWNDLCPVADKNILELGPLECGHTYMLENLGASSVTSIESSKVSFLKCLIVKDLLGLKVNLLHGDFREYLKDCNDKFDIVLASGVLYHMIEPVQLINDISKITDNVFIWTNYYSEEIMMSFNNFDKDHISLSDGYMGYRQEYCYGGSSYSLLGKGTQAYSVWMKRGDILGALSNAGFDDVVILEESAHSSGEPCMTILASKNDGYRGG